MPSSGTDQTKYFASLPLDEFLPRLFERIDHYYQHVQELGLLNLWRACHAASYSGFYVGGRINSAGQNGRFSQLEANELRNLITHTLNMITAQKSQPQAQARNMDHQSQQQTAIANGLAETLSDDKQLERVRQEVTDKGLTYGEGWGVPLWNKDLGDVYTIDQEPVIGEDGQPVLDEQGQPRVNPKPLRAGDIEYHVMHSLDVVRDATKTSADKHAWYCGRRVANRYDLMAMYPKYADRIAKLPPITEYSSGDRTRPRLFEWNYLRNSDSDDVWVWDFMHDKTPAVPHGRLVSALAPDLAIVDDALPYRTLPHVRWSAADIDGTSFGYTLTFDLLALQQGINAGVSAITTRMATFALPTVSGSPNTRLENLGDGMTCLSYGEGEAEPKLLDFAQIPDGLVQFIKMLRDLMATYSGINSVARGQPEGGVTAASALALLEARAIQFVALSQKADIEFMRRLFTTSLHHFQDHAIADVIIRMVGQGERSRVMAFKPSDFGAVDGYSITIGNALQATPAGRLQIIENAKALGVPFTPEQYLQVLETGRWDPVVEGPNKELEFIRSENEGLSRGEPQRALITDNHQLHIQEHKVVVADPDVRKDPNSPIIAATLEHIQEHQMMIAPPPMPVGPGAPPPGPGAPHVAPPPAPPQAGGPAVKTEKAEPAKNPATGLPNPHPQVSA